jgi:methionyl-tRNA synthetase
MRRLAQVVLDTIALLRQRLAQGRQVSHLAAFLAAAGSALHPQLSARILHAYGISEEDATRMLVRGDAVEYAI